MTSKPVAVIIGDIHFTVPTLELASRALTQARDKALELKVPLVMNGDTLDGKAMIRGECANRIMEVLDGIDIDQVYINTGNHDLISVKGTESSLNFLRPYGQVVQVPTWVERLQSYIVPYFDDTEELQEFLNTVPEGSRLTMHQGVMTANMGHYVKDSSSLPKDAFANFRVISGHYHMAQDIKCGRPRKGAVGLFSYVGNPYTLSFGEANDPPKGYAVLHANGVLERIPTNLRKHVIIERVYDRLNGIEVGYTLGDLVWLKVYGPRSELAKLNKAEIAKNMFFGDLDFKLDPIATDSGKVADKMADKSASEVLDALIDAESETDEQKVYLKQIWRDLCG